jgi:DNA topoisomerase 2-associated protein PAT1
LTYLASWFAAENFDAGQYAFFGKDSPEGLDLGCLEDGSGDGNGGGYNGPEEGLHRLSSVGEEVWIPEPSRPQSGHTLL